MPADEEGYVNRADAIMWAIKEIQDMGEGVVIIHEEGCQMDIDDPDIENCTCTPQEIEVERPRPAE